jgi:hypothetical protein
LFSIESSVNDFSTFPADTRIDANKSIQRNIQRVKSYFSNPGHIVFLINEPINNECVGFFQFVVEGNKALGVNAAVSSKTQNFFYGPWLYSNAISALFEKNENIKVVEGGFGLNNKRVLNIFQQLNFKIKSREIHFRKVTQEC